MDRMLLYFPLDSSDDDFEMVSRVICPQNVIETELFLLTLKRASDTFFENALKRSGNLLKVALKSVTSTNKKTSLEGVHNLNEIIYRISTDTTVFLDALLARSLYYFRTQKFPLALSDLTYYKCFDPKLMTPEDLILVQTLQCCSSYFMREMKDARLYLSELEEVLEQFPLKNVPENNEIHTFLRHLAKYKEEIKQSSSNIQYEINKKSINCGPSNGFKYDYKIPYSSTACNYDRKPIGVCARFDIARGATSISQDHLYFQFSTPFRNCEVCEVYGVNLYTCTKCRYKSYCSLSCINLDWEEHKYECYGYKIGLIQMLEVTLLFKLFLQAANYMSPIILNYTIKNGPIRDATVAWNLILKHARAETTHYTVIGKCLSTQPDYQLVTVEKRRQLIITSFRLAVFVYNNTNIKEIFLGPLELTKNDSIRLISAILVRLNAHISLNCQQNKLQNHQSISSSYDCPDFQLAVVARMKENAFGYFSIDAHSDFINCYNNLQARILSTKNVRIDDDIFPKIDKHFKNEYHGTSMSEYINKLFTSCFKNVKIQSAEDLFHIENSSFNFIEQCITKLNTSKRCELLLTVATNFHKFINDYFFYDGRSQEKKTLCINIKNVQPACKSNIAVTYGPLIDGQHIGMTTKHMETETIPHDVINQQCRSENLASLQDNGIKCKCDDYTFSVPMEPIACSQGIFCACCEQDIEITPELGKCSECHSEYNGLLKQYAIFISFILNEIQAKETSSEDNQRELAILYGTYSSYLTMHFSGRHELHFSGILSFVKFLTLNGFLNQACDIIFTLYSSDYCVKNRETDTKIFSIVRQIIERYINNHFNTSRLDVDPSYAKSLLAISLRILRTQKHQALKEDSAAVRIFLENYTQHRKWKKIIISSLTMSTSLQDYLNN